MLCNIDRYFFLTIQPIYSSDSSVFRLLELLLPPVSCVEGNALSVLSSWRFLTCRFLLRPHHLPRASLFLKIISSCGISIRTPRLMHRTNRSSRERFQLETKRVATYVQASSTTVTTTTSNAEASIFAP